MNRVIAQAPRRILEGAAVPAEEKVLSLFDPHPQFIKCHKAGKSVAFGRKPLLDEVAGRIISGYDLLEDGGMAHLQLLVNLARHRQRFGHAPDLLAGDRDRLAGGA